MTAPTYIPQGGTIPAKVIAFLADKPLDQWFPTSVVLEAIGQPLDWVGLIPCMSIAIEHQAVRKDISHQEGTSRKVAMWARGPKAPTVEQLATPVPPPRYAPPAPAAAAASPEPTADTSQPVEIPEVLPAGEFSYTSAGRLLIYVSGGQVALTTDAADTLFYVDPPYPLSTRGNARGVRQKYACELTDDDHRRLAGVLHDLQGMVVLSGYPCALYDKELFAGWQRHERQAMADGGRTRTEVVWLNPACSAALERSRGGLFA